LPGKEERVLASPPKAKKGKKVKSGRRLLSSRKESLF